MDALKKIQQELKAPKNQRNNFGKYNYRSAEDILESVKPLLAKYDAQLTLCDEVVPVSDRIYVKATATITSGEETLAVSAYAREPAEKKGMDESQITGTASSYARKYALNGLFLIDDTKDPDTDEYHKQTTRQAQPAPQPMPQPAAPQTISPATVVVIDTLIKETETDRKKLLDFYHVTHLEELTSDQAKHCVASLRKKKNG